MSNDSVQREARPGTVAADPDVEILPAGSPDHRSGFSLAPRPDLDSMEVDWANEHLASAPVIVSTLASQSRTQIWQAANLNWYRRAGQIHVRNRDGAYRFEVLLAPGANRDDYNFLRLTIEDARSGRFERHGWQPYLDDAGERAWRFKYSRHYLDVDETHFLYEARDDSPKVIPCDDDRCRELVHDAAGDTHVADDTETDDYEISVERLVGGEGEVPDYRVCLVLKRSDVDMPAAAAASLANDLQWMSESCRRVNLQHAA